MKYKFRAECKTDVLGFIAITIGSTHGFQIEPLENSINIPDVEVVFESELSLNELLDEMRKVPDGHVMMQTLKPFDHYTGEREYSIT
jgi:hypothetical protein